MSSKRRNVKQREPAAIEAAIACPSCPAEAGGPCVHPRTRVPRRYPHRARARKALGKATK